MKNRVVFGLGLLLLSISVAGCIQLPSIGQSTEEYSEEEYDDSEFDEYSELISEEDTEEETETEISDEYSFEDLSKSVFYFSSGAGGWATEMIIEKDGYFKGNYHDTDLGDTGEGYEEGTMYSSTCRGHFTDFTKISDTCYEMTLADITYDDEVGTDEFEDNMHYVYTDAYGITGTEKFRVYFPGTPIDMIPEEVYTWIQYDIGDETELTMICIENVDEQEGFSSFQRSEPSEDAQMTYNAYKESYDYYADLITNSTTQADITINSENQYRITDQCLSYLWDLVKYNVDEDEFQTLLEEQREWIESKESTVNELPNEGSMADADRYQVMAEMTMTRCAELVEYLQ